MINVNQLRDVLIELQKAEKIAIFTHTNPDGDALGSSFAMKAALESLGKMATVFLEKEIPEKYAFLNQGYALCGNVEDFDAGLALDCGSISRLGGLEPLYSAMPLRLVVDHHLGSEPYGDVYYTDPDSAACAELIYSLCLDLCGVLPENCLVPLYTGISTDTGHFKYSNVTPKTMEIGADLIRAGLDHRAVTRILYDTVKLDKLKFTGILAEKIQLYHHGSIAVLYCPDSFLSKYGLAHEDVEELPNTVLSVEGTKASIIIKEKDENSLKVSLRGKENIDMAALAGKFGGGGHRNAAGLVTKLSPEDITKALVEEIAKGLEEANG